MLSEVDWGLVRSRSRSLKSGVTDDSGLLCRRGAGEGGCEQCGGDVRQDIQQKWSLCSGR